MGTVASPAQLQQLISNYDILRRQLPEGYTPSYHFAAGPDNVGMYAYPASAWDVTNDNPAHTEFGNLVDNGTLLPDDNGPLPGSLANNPEFLRDYNLWNARTNLSWGGSQADDDFHGFVANVFGNTYTLPALFAGAAMGANAGAAASGGSTASSLGVKGATAGLGLTQNPSGGGLGGAAGALAGAATGIPGASTVGAVAGGVAGGALAGSFFGGSNGSSGSGSTPGTQGAGSTTTPGGTMAPGLGQSGTQPDLSDEDMLAHLRRFGLAGIQPRQGLVGAGLSEAEQAANASSQRLLTGLRSQITQLRQGLQGQFAQASRALGSAGSKMIQGAQGSALAQAGGQLSNLLLQGGAKGQGQLLSVLQGLKPGVVTALQAPNTTISQGPADFSGLTALLTGAGALSRALPGGLSTLLGLTKDDTTGSDLGTGGWSPSISTEQVSGLAEQGALNDIPADQLFQLYGP